MRVGARVLITEEADNSAFIFRGRKGVVIRKESIGLVIVKLDSGNTYPFWPRELRLIGKIRDLPEWF